MPLRSRSLPPPSPPPPQPNPPKKNPPNWQHTRAKNLSVSVFNFQRSLMEVKTGHSSVHPNKGGLGELYMPKTLTVQLLLLPHASGMSEPTHWPPTKRIRMVLVKWYVYDWPLYTGLFLLSILGMKGISKGTPRSTHLHTEIEIKERGGILRCGKCMGTGHNSGQYLRVP